VRGRPGGHARNCYQFNQCCITRDEKQQKVKQEIPKQFGKMPHGASHSPYTLHCIAASHYSTSRGGTRLPFNTLYLGPTLPTIPNSISIQSAVFAKYTFVTNGQTDGQAGRRFGSRAPAVKLRAPQTSESPLCCGGLIDSVTVGLAYIYLLLQSPHGATVAARRHYSVATPITADVQI